MEDGPSKGSSKKSIPESKLWLLAQDSVSDSLVHLRVECVSCMTSLIAFINTQMRKVTQESGNLPIIG